MNFITPIKEKCTECRLCLKECLFLQRYGTPKAIADRYNPVEVEFQYLPFECSLCGLCSAVCPADLNPGAMFLDMRREMVRQGKREFSNYTSLLNYEKRGISKKYTWYGLPRGCDTVLFPGCALPGARPGTVINLYEHLKGKCPSLGIVLDCCTKPSHDLGRQDYFEKVFGEIRGYLLSRGIKTVWVTCPNCYKVFKEYGAPLQVQMVYEVLPGFKSTPSAMNGGTVTVHDPCVIRFDKEIHRSVRDLIESRGTAIEEMDHQETKTLCCGEGGAVGFINPELAQEWGIKRNREAGNRPILTYCSGCVNYLSKRSPTHHLLDFYFAPEATLQDRLKTSKAPFTYWNRLQLKRKFIKMVSAVISRERVL
jgi:Fe-S oxidoreductase